MRSEDVKGEKQRNEKKINKKERQMRIANRVQKGEARRLWTFMNEKKKI